MRTTGADRAQAQRFVALLDEDIELTSSLIVQAEHIRERATNRGHHCQAQRAAVQARELRATLYDLHRQILNIDARFPELRRAIGAQ